MNEYGCELAPGRRDRDGYAFDGDQRAHIAAWVAAKGPLPRDKYGEQLELDHLCRNRGCRALDHLEPVTRSENEKRKSWRHRKRIARCPKGHDMEINAVITPQGGRVCRTCNREAQGAKQ